MKTLLVMAGGTGGHVMPALAVANKLRDRGVHIVWMGTEHGIESELVPAAGFPLELVNVRGIRGTGLLRKIGAPFVLLAAALQAMRIILRCKADAILGMGGYVSGPGGLMGRLLRRPLVLHEQNAIAGTTNKLLAPFANRVMSGFERVTGLTDTTWTGNPVRSDIVAIEPPHSRLLRDAGHLQILVVGGSQGARVFNEQLPGLFSQLQQRVGESCELHIFHQCGRGNAQAVIECYAETGLNCEVQEFVEDMAGAYSSADVVICRAGAMTVAEVAAAGVAALFVPLPYAIDDHQFHNAMVLSERGAALCYRQDQFIAGEWLEQLSQLAADREQLVAMAERARENARGDATEQAADICMEVLDA